MSNQGWNNNGGQGDQGWNTSGQGGYSQGGQGWNTPAQGQQGQGWNNPNQGQQGQGWNNPGQGQQGQGWNNPNQGQQGQGWGGQGQPQGGYPYNGQGGYQQPDQTQALPPGGGYPQGGAPTSGGGGGNKLPLIIAGAILLLGIIGVAIFFLTRGESGTASPQPTTSASASPTRNSPDPKPTRKTPSPEPTKVDPTPTPTTKGPEPTPTTSGLPIDTPELTIDDVPAEVDGWKAAMLADYFITYQKAGTTGTITIMELGDGLKANMMGIALEGAKEYAGGRMVCGTASGFPTCYLDSQEFGLVNLFGTEQITAEQVAVIGEAIMAKLP